MKEHNDPKKTRKMECPYCHSTNVEMAGIQMGVDTARRSGQGYECLSCGQFFLSQKAA